MSDKGKNTCWKMFIKYPHLPTGVGSDDNVDAAEKFVCMLFVIEEKGVNGIDNASLFAKLNRDLEILPPTKYS